MAVGAALLHPGLHRHRRHLEGRRRRGARRSVEGHRHHHGPHLADRPRAGRHDEEVRRRVQQDLPRGEGQVRGHHRLRGRSQDPDEHRGLRRRPADPGGDPDERLPEVLRAAGHRRSASKKYRFTDYTTVDGKVYGRARSANANGFVYNKKVWKQAGITDCPPPRTSSSPPCKAIKAKTDAIPLYTNYKDGWPLTSGRYVAARSAATRGHRQARRGRPLGRGRRPTRRSTRCSTTSCTSGLTEDDPTTTNWEQSKTRSATGKIAT